MIAVQESMFDHPWYWLVVGFGGQALFTSRFLVQWVVSERAKRSIVPTAFWWLSIIGSLLLLSWACYRLDPVIILGQVTGTVIYSRNLVLLRRAREAAANAP